ncbi:MAG: carboxypeptidase regulatory-like domain-containing protein, partial [Chthoniobacterales bacterium]
MKKKFNTSAFVRPLSLIGLVLCGFGLLLAIFAFGAPLAFAQRGSPNQRNDGTPVPKSKAPLLTMENAPDLPQCRGVLNQEIVDLVNSASEDPAVVFERNRREHPHMIAMPPTTDCASALWRTIRDKGVAKPSVDANSINLRQYMPYSVFNSAPLAALIGTNINLSNGVEGYQGETNIAINPNNPLQLVAHSNTFFKDTTAQCQSPTGGTANTFGSMALFGSTDGGATWKYNCAPWHTGATGGVPGATAWFGSDPALAWDNQGRAYATYMLLSQSSSSNGVSIVVARSTDSGQSWAQFGNPVVNRITATTALDDKEFMAIDNTSGQAHSFPGRIYVVWDEGNVERVAFSDTGATWTTVLLPSGTAAIGGNLVVAADGTVYLVWTRYNVETIVFSKSIDGGANWTAPVVIATNALQSFGSNNHPPAQDQRGINGFASIDVDRNPASAFFGYVYVAYNDFPSGTTSGPDLNVYTVRSTDGGTNWSTRVKVNDDNWGASQFFPWLAVDQSDGSVNVSWVDSRIDPINRKTQAVYARSVNGGASYEANLLVHDNGAQWRNNVNYSDENAVDNPTFNGNQYGDYTGIVASNRQVHPLWTDSRSYFPLADTQAPTRREDNATSTITNCSAPSAVAPPSVNSSATPSVAVTWAAPAGWGTNATDGTYSVYRNTTSVFPAGAALASGLTATSYVDTTGVANTTYFYFVRAKNNCSGTALTAMTSDSGASASVVYGSTGTATGMLQGTVTAAGNGNPLGNVVVFAGTLSATTNGSGFYQIPAINAGSYTVSSSPAGYMAGSVNGVTVSGGATKVQNLALTPNAANNCFTDTNFGDFSTGAGTNADIASTPGSVKLANSGGEAADQVSSPSSLFIGNTPTATTWSGQTFQAGTTGTLTKISVALGLNSGSTGALTVEIRDVSGANPGSTVLATGTLGPVTNVGTAAIYTTTFASPAAVVSGTSYSVVLKGNSGSVFSVIGNTSSLPNGQFLTTITSGSSWTAMPSSDLDFTTFVTSPVTYQTSGNFVSSTKDSGAVVGTTPTWTTLSWNNVALPAGTNLRFQAAASNSATGPFNFVGPDNTAATFFSSGGSLAQFNGNRYLQYKALLTTSNTSNTPTLNDVTVCSADLVPPILTSASSRQLHAGGAGTF